MLNRMILDEYHHADDAGRLEERVRAVAGVPPYRYLIKGDLVFVFAKLVSLVRGVAGLTEGSGPLDEAIVLGLVQHAHTTAIEAVRDWGVLPTPYVVDHAMGRLQVRHVPFHATLPEEFPHMEGAQDALSVLLAGGVVSADRPGDFAYRGQPLKRLPGLASTLPPKPTFGWSHSGGGRSEQDMLREASDIAGFQPLRTGHAGECMGARDLWDRERARLVSSSVARMPDVWRRLGEIEALRPGSFEREFHASGCPVPEDGAETVLELRELYPEMRFLSDTTLLDEFESWDLFCNARPRGPHHDDMFPLHALGRLASRTARDAQAEEAILRGAAIVRSWLHLDPGSMDAANRLADEACSYDRTIREMSFRHVSIHVFLQQDAQTPYGQGPPVRTPGDFVWDTMMVGRKHGPAIQAHADLAGP